jgi:ketosteroid isomerase-like protein
MKDESKGFGVKPSQEKDFEQFMRTRTRAAEAYVNGDVTLLDAVSTHAGPATFFGPDGAFVTGATDVRARYAKDAKHFAPGGQNALEILHSSASGELGYWVGFQRATAKLEGKKDPVPMTLRVSEIFRRESGEWKLIHRHAEMVT